MSDVTSLPTNKPLMFEPPPAPCDFVERFTRARMSFISKMIERRVTHRTRNVAMYLVQNYSVREISERLSLTESGVKYHTTILYKNLGITDINGSRRGREHLRLFGGLEQLWRESNVLFRQTAETFL